MTISFLSLLIAFKIGVTLCLVCLPFLMMPKARLERLVGVTAASDTFFRLYGVAILALLFGYATAFPLIEKGHFPWGVTGMGVISNGGATFILIRSGAGTVRRIFGPIYGLICLGLLGCMAWHKAAMTPIF